MPPAAAFMINEKKSVLPTQSLSFLETVIDMHDQSLSLPEDNLKDLKLEINNWPEKKRTIKR